MNNIFNKTKKWKNTISISRHLKDKGKDSLSLHQNKERNYQISSYKKNKKINRKMRTNCSGVTVMKSKTYCVKKLKKMKVVC